MQCPGVMLLQGIAPGDCRVLRLYVGSASLDATPRGYSSLTPGLRCEQSSFMSSFVLSKALAETVAILDRSESKTGDMAPVIVLQTLDKARLCV